MTEELTYSTFESRYKDKKYIGAGGFGKVYKVFDHAKNHYVALKVSDVRPEWNKFTLKNEVELVNKMPFHRNIARYDACYRFNTGITGEMDFALLKFYENGNLEQFLKKEDLSKEDKKLIISGILNGLLFLHQNNIIHRDLKSQNVLLSREDGVWTPKITDFGLSREVEDGSTITNSAVGISYAYAAPEQILNKKIHKNVDLWAMGVIIYRVIADELPFKGRSGGDKSSESQLELSKKIIELQLPDRLETMEEPYQAMVRRCFVLDPTERVQTPDELLNLLSGKITPSEVKNVTETNSDPEPVPSDDEKTQVLQYDKNAGEYTDRSKQEGHTIPQYEEPSQNRTQIIQRETPIKENEPPAPVKEYKPNVGDDKRSFKAKYVIIPLLIAAVGFASWWFYKNGSSTGNAQIDPAEMEVISIESKALVDSGEKISELMVRNEESGGDKDELMEISDQLHYLIKAEPNSNDYRLFYLLAKNQTYRGESLREVHRSLEKSIALARDNSEDIEILDELLLDKEKAFEHLSKLQRGEVWNGLLSDLERTLE